jgi:3-methyladenine DNA glycosylase AlkD
MTPEDVLCDLRPMGSSHNVAGMASFGIVSEDVFGISMPRLKDYARGLKKTVDDRHKFAERLWQSGVYEAKIVAYLIDDPKKVTEEQMESWARDFDNWAIVDGTCGHLFCRTPLAYKKAVEWCDAEEEFKKRAAFSLMAFLTVHDKKADEESLAAFLPLIEKHASDERPLVKKAVNWALRQIGKQDMALNERAIRSAERIREQGGKAARWIASDALRELTNERVKSRIIERERRKK